MGLFSNLFKKAEVRNPLEYNVSTREFFGFDLSRHNYDGENAIKNGYNGSNDLYSILQKVVKVSTSIPFITQTKNDKGIWELNEKNTILELLNKPNSIKKYTWDDLYEMIIIYLYVTGDAYVLGETGYNDKKIASLDVLPSNMVCVEDRRADFFLPNLKYQFDAYGRHYTYTSDQLAHIKLFNPLFCNDHTKGLGIVKVANDVIQTMTDKWDASASLFQNRGMSGMITDKSNRPMTQPEAQDFQKKFNKDTAGTKKFGGIKVTNKDLQYIQMGMSAEDLKIVEQTIVGLRALCNVMGLDSSLFNDPDNKTYANREEAEKSMYTNCIIPISNKVCSALTAFIAPNHYPDQAYRITQDFERVECLQANKKLEAEKDQIELQGIATILTMPISSEAKIQLIKDTYDVSDEFLKQLTITQANEGQPEQ